jgi:hypothetical protein
MVQGSGVGVQGLGLGVGDERLGSRIQGSQLRV